MDNIYLFYFIGSILLFISVIASSFSARIGMPLLVIFLCIGMLAGNNGIGKLEFTQYSTANIIGQAALVIILLDGGLRTSIDSFKIALKPAATLASWGVLSTVAILGIFVTWLLSGNAELEGIDWRSGILMAAIVGSTDAAAVFSLLRNGGVRLNSRVQSTLEIESGANDPVAILLVAALIILNKQPESVTAWSFIVMLIEQLGFGVLFGFLSGYSLAKLLAKIKLAEGMYAILILSAAMLVFSFTVILGGSGFLAIYIASVIIGNRKTRATEHVLKVVDGMAWLSQTVLFVMLGLLVTPSNVLALWPYVLGISFFLIFIARPLAVFSGLYPFRFKMNEMGFISWVGLRGAVPVTLAIMPVMENVPYSGTLFDLTFGVVIVSLMFQGTTIPFMAKFFKVKIPATAEPIDGHEIWVANRASIYIYAYRVTKGSFAITNHPDDIAQRIDPDEVRVFTMVRNGQIEPILPSTILRAGDLVWYTVRGNHASDLAKIFTDTFVTRQERNDFFGEWIVSPQVKMGDLTLLDEVNLNEDLRDMPISDFIVKSLGTLPVVGDHVDLRKGWDFVVRETSNDGSIAAVGLKLDVKKGKANEDKKIKASENKKAKISESKKE